MKVSIIPHVQDTIHPSFQEQTVVVIDVFRASSSIVTAFAHGAKSIIPVETVTEALKKRKPGILLAGERQTCKIKGFDLGNSPSEFQNSTVEGKSIVFTTTNGTRALIQCQGASHILIGSLLNAEACSDTITQYQRDVTLFCAGTEGRFSFEDAICAGAIISYLKEKKSSLQCDDLGETLYQSFFSVLKAGFIPLFQHNAEKLSEQDRKDCLKFNQYSIVPYLENGELKILENKV